MMSASLRLISRPLLASLFAGAIALTACWVEPDNSPSHTVSEPEPSTTPVGSPTGGSSTAPSGTGTSPGGSAPSQATVQTGQTLQSDAGQGAGVFLEYWGGGDWYVWATCDTARTNLPCHFQISATPEGSSTVSKVSQNPSDDNQTNSVATSGNQLDIRMLTTLETDGVQFHVEPAGAGLQLETWLDGSHDGQVVYWVDPAGVRQGAPSNPALFVPSTP
jgi:hypothetical protein